jgi:hypothetical protein
MRSETVAHSSLVLVTIASVISLAACGGSSPAPAQTSSQSTERPGSPDFLASATPAPGTEGRKPDEHPELAHLTQVSTDFLAQSITDYVQAEAARQGGVFTVNDPEQRTSLGLTLMTVHREGLSKLADGRYFACADFKGADGHTYDVDAFMRVESTGLVPTDVIVHKQDGKARFNWAEQSGIWSPVPVVTP